VSGTRESAADELRAATRRHLARPVPRVSDHRLETARAALIGYDAHVAGVGQRVDIGADVPREWLEPDAGLDQRLADLAALDPPGPAGEVEALAEYKRGLDTVLELSRRALDGRTGA
jgi:hypothetical protein